MKTTAVLYADFTAADADPWVSWASTLACVISEFKTSIDKTLPGVQIETVPL